MSARLLLLLGCAALGCSTATTDPPTGETTMVVLASSSGGDATGGDTGGDTGGTSSSGTAATSMSDTADSSTGAGGDATVCEAYAETYAECDPDYTFQEALGFCQSTFDAQADRGPVCIAALGTYYTCLAGLTCDEWFNSDVCTFEFEEVQGAC